MNGMAAVRRYYRIKDKEAANQAASSAFDDAIRLLAIGQRPRVTRTIAQRLLLGSPHMWDGAIIDVVGKSVGAGVWEMSQAKEKSNG